MNSRDLDHRGSIAALCRREGLAPNLYYRWSKEFLEAGKKRWLGDTTREATSTEVQDDLRRENSQLKQSVSLADSAPNRLHDGSGHVILYSVRRCFRAWHEELSVWSPVDSTMSLQPGTTLEARP